MASTLLTDPGVPRSGPVAVALGQPRWAALAELGADLVRDLSLHQLHISVLTSQQLVGGPGSGHPAPFGHRGDRFVDLADVKDKVFWVSECPSG